MLRCTTLFSLMRQSFCSGLGGAPVFVHTQQKKFATHCQPTADKLSAHKDHRQRTQLRTMVSFAKAILVVYAIAASLLLISHKSNAESTEFGARGFNDNIDWKPLEEARSLAKENNKPIMLLIHKSWCGACQRLKPEFAGSDEIADLSSSFVMTNTEDDEEPKGDEFAPDGGYIPRILFMDPNGKVLAEYYNEIGHPDYKYFYTEANQVIQAMVRVADHFEKLSSANAIDE